MRRPGSSDGGNPPTPTSVTGRSAGGEPATPDAEAPNDAGEPGDTASADDDAAETESPRIRDVLGVMGDDPRLLRERVRRQPRWVAGEAPRWELVDEQLGMLVAQLELLAAGSPGMRELVEYWRGLWPRIVVPDRVEYLWQG